MSWFQRKTAGIKTQRTEQNESPEGYWRQDPNTGEMVSLRSLEENFMVTESGHHFPLSGLGYCRMLFDDGQFERFDEHLVSDDPLGFHDRKPYGARLEAAHPENTGRGIAAVRYIEAQIPGISKAVGMVSDEGDMTMDTV